MNRLTWVIRYLPVLMLCISGCHGVQNPRGWTGPDISVAVSAQGGSVTMQAPTGGWLLSVDRSAIADGIATLWITATRPAGPVAQSITPVTVHWKAPLGRNVNCIEALLRQHGAFYEPAAEACH
jgi:hypothetical protein